MNLGMRLAGIRNVSTGVRDSASCMPPFDLVDIPPGNESCATAVQGRLAGPEAAMGRWTLPCALVVSLLVCGAFVAASEDRTFCGHRNCYDVLGYGLLTRWQASFTNALQHQSPFRVVDGSSSRFTACRFDHLQPVWSERSRQVSQTRRSAKCWRKSGLRREQG